MSRLFIVAGFPATGKTTFAKALSKELNIACLLKDSIKENLFDSFEMDGFDDSRKIGMVSFKLFLELAEEYIKNGVDVIIESPFHWPSDIKLFNNWKRNYKIEIYSIICEIDEKERMDRFVNRLRHRAHHDIDSLLEKGEHDKEAWEKCDYNIFPGTIIKLKTNKSVEQLIEFVKSFL